MRSGSVILVLACLSCATVGQAEADGPLRRVSQDALAADGAVVLFQDSRERLLVADARGLRRYDGKDDTHLFDGPVNAAVLNATGDVVFVNQGRLFAPGEDASGWQHVEPQNPKIEVDYDAGLWADRYGAVWLAGARLSRDPDGAWVLDKTSLQHGPKDPVPEQSDPFGNAWYWLSPGRLANRRLDGRTAEQQQLDLPHGAWHFLAIDDFGCFWIGGERGLAQWDPRSKSDWHVIDRDNKLPHARLTALSVGPDCNVVAGFADGAVAFCQRIFDGDVTVEVLQPGAGEDKQPGPVRALFADSRGRTWAAIGSDLHAVAPADNAWQKNWRVVARLPYSNHDLRGTVHDGALYIAGGATQEFGFPPKWHVSSRVQKYAGGGVWQTVARLRTPRYYNGLAELNGELWVVGGQMMVDGKRVKGTMSVEIVDLASRQVRAGPDLLAPRDKPLAVYANGRVYVTGGAHGHDRDHPPLESIGPGEDTWRAEPPAPQRIGTAAVCVLNGVIYIAAQNSGLLAFDTTKGEWLDVPNAPQKPRAAQLTGFNGRVWMVGGRDMKQGNETYIYDPATRTWSDGPALPRPLAWGAAGVVKGQLVVAGGAYHDHRRFTFSDRTWVLRGNDGQ